jgi:hypothetical protein
MIKKENKDQNHTFIKESHSFEYVFFLLISVILFENNYYKHQYFSIIILSILGIIEYIIYISIFKKLNIYLIFINIFLSIVKSFLTSMIYGYINLLMRFKYYSIYKASYFLGVNVPIIVIIYIISSYIPLDNDNYFCFEKYNGTCYFDNIYSLFQYFSQTLIILFLSVINALSYCIFTIAMNLILYNFTIFHLLLPWQIYESFNTIIDSQKDPKNYFLIFFHIFEIFFILVFIEFIELKFCGFDYNIKKNIQKRASKDPLMDESSKMESNDSLGEDSEQDNRDTIKGSDE